MPTILKIKGYRFHFYASDKDEPPHVHISKGEDYAKIWLEPSVEPQYFYKYKAQEEREIAQLVKENESYLKKRWYEFFK